VQKKNPFYFTFFFLISPVFADAKPADKLSEEQMQFLEAPQIQDQIKKLNKFLDQKNDEGLLNAFFELEELLNPKTGDNAL
jgi:hypothetical protein